MSCTLTYICLSGLTENDIVHDLLKSSSKFVQNAILTFFAVCSIIIRHSARVERQLVLLSARQSLTSVFGMGTGGPSALITPTLHLQGFEPGTH